VKQRYISVLLSLLFVFSLGQFQRQAAYAACLSFSDLIQNGSYIVADPSGKVISSCNPNKSFIPASIIKIQTALAAFQILGLDFRFQTAFYTDQQDNLYIKGYGDPFLVSEEIEIILSRLRKRGVNRINSISIDNSSFALSGQVPGRGKSDNPYDSPVGAVGVNFNTVSLRVDDNGRIISAEPQTPTLLIMKELGKGLKQGEYRVNICRKDCQPKVQTVRYATELFRELQRRMTIPGEGQLGSRKVPEEAELVYIHKNTRSIDEVVSSLLKYSNNYVANQVYLVCGAEKYGYPATWQKAERAVREMLEDVLGAQTAATIHIKEGSGLSRENTIAAQAMMQTLIAFKPYIDLLQEKKGGNLKSGTLKGVYTYAGYLSDGKPFVIMLNQQKNTRDAVLKRLQKLSEILPR
jgi:D-alanyl-D-alanine carboxypeptidase/D-alanyl-D-alanine-endopeptidase (penicillin-binding protein 4)